MIKDILSRILLEYITVCTEALKDHPFAYWMHHDVPQQFQSIMPEFQNLIWKASVGQGNWAHAPWIAVIDPLITDTVQGGFYPVYLFSKSLDKVYLSLNQGVSHLKEELGYQAKEILAQRAFILQVKNSEFRSQFDSEPINLNSPGPQSLLAFYESGHAFGKLYLQGSLPSEEELVSDLRGMLKLYSNAIVRGGTQELETTGHAVAEQGDEYLTNISLEEKRRLRLHYRAERNQRLARLAKKIHGDTCQICGFNFFEFYGELGQDYIEAHHLTPLHELLPDKPISLSPQDDFVVLCANCHRMIHRERAPKKIEDFRALLTKLNLEH